MRKIGGGRVAAGTAEGGRIGQDGTFERSRYFTDVR